MLSVTDPRLFAPGQEARAASFARRLLRLPEVRSIEIDPSQTTAKVRYRSSPGDQEIVVGRLADALANEDDPESETMPKWQPGEIVKLRRYGSLITFLEILTLDKSCLEVRHRDLVRDSPAGRRIVDVLREIPDVLEADIDTGKLNMRLDPAVASAAELVRRIETELLTPPDPQAVPAAGKVDFDMAHAQLGVSSVGDFVLPAVMPVAAAHLSLQYSIMN